MNEPGPEQTSKVDPETMVLRATPARVTRFRRGAVIGIAALGSTAIVGATWLALKPPTFRIVATGQDRGESAAKMPADALAGAPTGYGDVPKLGPPLPGDLGRPLLDAQRAAAARGSAAGTEADIGGREGQRLEAERERAATEERSARQSGLLVSLSETRSNASAGPGSAVAEAAGSQKPPSPPSLPAGKGNSAIGAASNGKVAFVEATNTESAVNPHELTPAPSPLTLVAGSVIAASLITGLNSDLPGLVTAQVTQNAYDSVTGRTLLIPQGSRLIGKYDSVMAFGQRRALVVWQRLILPDGGSIQIDNMPASDTRGYAGLADKLDLHTWQLLKGVALSTVLGVGTALSISDDSDLLRAIQQSAQQSGSRAADQLVSKSLGVQPTVTVRPGWPLRVVVSKDIVLPPWRGS